MMWAACVVLGAGGWTLVDTIMFVCFALGLPWTVLGFWNSVIGLWLLHWADKPMEQVAPYAAAGDLPTPITVKTAILMTLRNEDPARAFRRLRTVKDSVDATGLRRRSIQLLHPVRHQRRRGRRGRGRRRRSVEARSRAGRRRSRIVYRRRTDNTGFKAGNVRDFCDRWGNDYELMLPLDADSLMSGEAIVRLTRMMQAHPKLGILQCLVVGMPSSSARSRASSSSACATACAPTPWARAGGRPIAVRSGATTRWCASSRSRTTATCRCCRASRRSAATCCATTRSRRP